MNVIAKTLLQQPSPGKWLAYQRHFQPFFVGRDRRFDALIDLLESFERKFQTYPSIEVVRQELTNTGESDLLAYVDELAVDARIVPVAADDQFYSHLRHAKTKQVYLDVNKATQDFLQHAKGPPFTLPSVLERFGPLLASLTEAEQRALGDESGVSRTLYGQDALKNFSERYEAEPPPEYPLPFPALKEVRMRPGDLVFVGAFTSEGKSAMLRMLAYRLAVVENRNVLFVTLETGAEVAENMFALLHAANDSIFPDGPKVSARALQTRTLTDEQRDFLFNIALPDLFSNPNYGTIHILQPSKARFTIEDLTRDLKSIEAQTMPVHVLVIDYVTYMHPVPPDRIVPPQPGDYNDLIKQLKRLSITHRNSRGEKAPLLCLTAAQVSRRAYAEALKVEARNADALEDEGPYGLDAFSTYTEIERSADIAMTTFMPATLSASSQMKLQVHKNRVGMKHTAPVTLYIDFEYGMTILGSEEGNARVGVENLQSLNL